MDTLTMILNIFIISFLSALLWYERELKNQPAWIRTHMLIWIGSTLFMTISIMLPEIYGSEINDPGRIAAQVVSGVWFIWAWAIMKVWLTTKWLTTAANIWAISAIWLAVWAWMYTLAFVVTWTILLTLILISKLKTKIIKNKIYFNITTFYKKWSIKEKDISKTIKKLDINIINKSIENVWNDIKLKILLSSREKIDSIMINKKLKEIPNLKNTKIEQL